jgi:hypothetical protein
MITINSQIGDDLLVVQFLYLAKPNKIASEEAGRPIIEDEETCEIRPPGSRNYCTYPALSRSHWRQDPYSGEQVEVTYAERFPMQYQQFKAKLQQTQRGTSIDDLPFLTTGQRAVLRALNVYTAEALAAVDGQELKNLGPGGRDQKNHAIEYLDQSKARAPDTKMMAELEAAQVRLKILEEDNAILKSKMLTGEAQFEQMTIDGLREYIAANSGAAPQGNIQRKNLIRMALECRPREKAA